VHDQKSAALDRCTCSNELHRNWAFAFAERAAVRAPRPSNRGAHNHEMLHKTAVARYLRQRNFALDAWVFPAIIESKQPLRHLGSL
jgi:hypothetical protein